jgi:hypothetical protein
MLNAENMNHTQTEKADPTGHTPTSSQETAPPARQAGSLKRWEANRRNARKSTGPKSPAGRAAVRMNALKHGLFSTEVLVQGLHIKENSQEFSALYERFWQDLNPVGPVEEMLVEQIVTTRWRWRRALTAESGEIALSVDGGQWNRRLNPELLGRSWNCSQDPISRMKESFVGLAVLAGKLCEVRAAVEQEGELTTDAIQRLVPTLGDTPDGPVSRLQTLRLNLLDHPEGLDAAAWRERNKKKALAYLDGELSRLESLKDACEEREAQEERSLRAASVLPSRPALEKIIRYESKLERQLYRALNQLERLQRLRRGEAVPPPLQMEVSA